MVDQYETYDYDLKHESIFNAATGDQPSLDDSLGFSPYIKAIKDFLTNPNTEPPMTLSIEGPWGSGKTSFMMQLKKILEDNGEYAVIFNAWRHDKEDIMWASFALEFIRQLSKNLSFFQTIRAECKLLRSRIHWKTKREDIFQLTLLFILIILYLVFFYFKGLVVHQYPIDVLLIKLNMDSTCVYTHNEIIS